MNWLGMSLGNLVDETARSTSSRRKTTAKCMHGIAEQTSILLKLAAAICVAFSNTLDLVRFVTSIFTLV